MYKKFQSDHLPLVLALASEPSVRGYNEMVALNRDIRASYDPLSQTSSVPEHAGSNATVCASTTGLLPFPDTNYPTDDD